jgi:hypothetical protein
MRTVIKMIIDDVDPEMVTLSTTLEGLGFDLILQDNGIARVVRPMCGVVILFYYQGSNFRVYLESKCHRMGIPANVTNALGMAMSLVSGYVNTRRAVYAKKGECGRVLDCRKTRLRQIDDDRRIVSIRTYSDDCVEIADSFGKRKEGFYGDVVMHLDPYNVKIHYDGGWNFTVYGTDKSVDMSLDPVEFDSVE